jgi:hypothetical protein
VNRAGEPGWVLCVHYKSLHNLFVCVGKLFSYAYLD